MAKVTIVIEDMESAMGNVKVLFTWEPEPSEQPTTAQSIGRAAMAWFEGFKEHLESKK